LLHGCWGHVFTEVSIMNAAAKALPRDPEHGLYVGALVVAFAAVFAGFARTYYLKSLFGTPALPWLVQLHGALMTAWFALFFTQTWLIASHRVAWHRRLGVLGAMLALAILVVGPVVLVLAVARELHAPHGNRFFITIFGFDLVVLTGFGILVGSALALRRRSDFHKRLMLLATCSIIVPAIARLPIGELPVWGLFYACVLLPAIVDTVRHRRLHPVFGWGAPLLIASQQLALLGAHTQVWRDFVVRLFA
jgi:hypothetical protein